MDDAGRRGKVYSAVGFDAGQCRHITVESFFLCESPFKRSLRIVSKLIIDVRNVLLEHITKTQKYVALNVSTNFLFGNFWAGRIQLIDDAMELPSMHGPSHFTRAPFSVL